MPVADVVHAEKQCQLHGNDHMNHQSFDVHAIPNMRSVAGHMIGNKKEGMESLESRIQVFVLPGFRLHVVEELP